MAACVNSEYDGRTDTVYSLDAPSVSAKAYPGVNVVSWKPVAGASSYNVTVYEEGAYKRGDTASGNSLTDTDLVNGKKYTYYVEAVSASNPGTAAREVYAKNSRGEASVTAIVPPAGTSALELPAYEGGYDGKKVNVEDAEKKVKDDKFVVSSENIALSVEKSNIYINFPAKAYLGYGISLLGNDLPNEVNVGGTWGKWVSNCQSNNTTITENLRVFNPGEYKVKISVKSYCNVWDDGNNDYSKYDYGNYVESVVESKETVKIATLDLSRETGSATAEYLSDGKTARISFTPAQKDSVNVPTGWYKVYRRVNGEYATTLVSGTVKESVGTATKYYIDDEIADKTKVYEYIVVVENDRKYGKAEPAKLPIETGLVFDTDKDNADTVLGTKDVKAEYLYGGNHFASDADNTVRISFTPAKKDGKAVPTSWYKVYRNESGKLDQTEITSATNKIMLDDKDPGAYVIYDADKSIGPAKSYVYTVVVENDGKTGTPATDVLKSEKKKTFAVEVEDAKSLEGIYNNIEWTFTVGTTDYDVKNVTAYLLMTKTTQQEPKANEVIAKGEVLSNVAKVKDSDNEYVVSKKGLSDGYAYVVVTATCDGYNDAVSNVKKTVIAKSDD